MKWFVTSHCGYTSIFLLATNLLGVHVIVGISNNVVREWTVKNEISKHVGAKIIINNLFFNLQVFLGNNDRYKVATEVIDPPIIAQYVRVKPKTWHGFVSMRVEFYGCTEGETSEIQRCQKFVMCLSETE